MVTTLSANAVNQVKSAYAIIPFVLLEIPGNVVACYRGPRPKTINSIEYQPNRFLEVDNLVETLEDDSGERTITFANIPLAGDEVLSRIEELNYSGAPVTISRLIIDPQTNEEIEFGETTSHEIFDVSVKTSSINDGESESTIEIVLRAPGFVGRRKTSTIRSLAEQQADHLADDTFFEGVTEPVTISREWGQRVG